MSYGAFPPDVEELPADHELYLRLSELEAEFEDTEISHEQFLYGLKEYAVSRFTEQHFQAMADALSEEE